MDEFDTLPPDADEQTRDRLAERFAPELRKLFADHPALAKLHADAPRGERFAQKTLGLALADLYNPAQLDVMIRAQRIIVDESRAAEKS